MPQRSRVHQLDAEATRAFDSALPSAWTTDGPSQGNDYGIDRYVEIFEEGGDASALRFDAQLKGTDEENLQKALKVAMPVDRLTYYMRLERPVLMVRYHSSTESLFVRWWQHGTNALPTEMTTETATFKWEKSDQWNEGAAEKIKSDVKRYRAASEAVLSMPVDVQVSFDSEVSSDEAMHMRKWLRREAARSSYLSARFSGTGALVELRVGKKESRLDFGGIGRASFAYPPGDRSRDEDFQEDACSICALVGIAAAAAGHRTEAARIILGFAERASSRFDPDFAFRVAFYVTDSGRAREALEFLERLISEGQQSEQAYKAAVSASAGIARASSEDPIRREDRNRLIELLECLAEIAESKGSTGIAGEVRCHLANVLSTTRDEKGTAKDDLRRAVRNFERAKGSKSDLTKEYQFHALLGAALAQLHEHEAACEAFEQALAINESDSSVHGRLADNALRCGHIEAALQSFGKYHELHIANGIDPDPYRLVGERFASTLKEKFGETVSRQAEEAKEVANSRRASITSEDDPKQLDKALHLDPLSAELWYRFGDSLIGTDKQLASRAYMFSAYLNETNALAWYKAAYYMPLELKEGTLPLAPLVAQAGYNVHGETFAAAILESMDDAGETERKHVEEWVESMRSQRYEPGHFRLGTE